MRDLVATPSRHKKRCDMMLCTGNSSMEFSRTNSTAGRLDLCQSCVDEIAKYATQAAIAPQAPQATQAPQEPVTPTRITASPNMVRQSVVESFPCQYCGKEVKSKIGLSAHEKACKDNPSNKSE